MNALSRNDAVNFGTLVRKALARNPADCAFRHGPDTLSRGEMLTASRALAEQLSACGIAAGEPVVLELGPSFHLVTGLCAVLMAGGVAVPVDPHLPDARRRAILDDVAPRLILRDRPDGTGVEIETRSCIPRLAPHLAFLVHTSGTSGRPKGVEISHHSYSGRLTHIVTAHPPAPDDVDLLWTPAGFIGMLDEVFFPLFQNIPAIIAPEPARRDPHTFASLIAQEKVTAFRITPSLLETVLTEKTARAFKTVRKIYCSGEMLDHGIQIKVKALTQAHLISFYGASEAPGVAFHLAGTGTYDDARLLYAPQSFARIKIMPDEAAPQMAGAIGEIWIGGVPVADGYWNRPELTAEKFITQAGQRWYRTGDLGIAHPAGQFEILGRQDDTEVNIMGVRVTPADTCDALRKLAAVKAAWVSAVELPHRRDPVLVGHCVPAEGHSVDPRALRAALASDLPGAAVPSAFVACDHLPLTANGKLDVRRLAQDAKDHVQSRTRVPRESGAQNGVGASAPVHLPVVLETVESLLGVSGLTGQEDFFDLGGNSLDAVRLTLTLSERIGVQFSGEIVFATDSLRGIAQACADGDSAGNGPGRLLRRGSAAAPPLFTINATQKYARLAKALNATGMVYNLNIFGLTNALVDQIETLTLHTLTDRLADALLALHPVGPWKLMAYCQDGCLAVELGRTLQARTGHRCELFLIDTFFLDHKPNFRMAVARMVDFGPWYYARKAAKKLLRRFRQAPSNEIETVQKSAAVIEKSKNDGRLYRRYIEFFTTYSPPPYDGRVNLFVSSEWKHVNLQCLREMANDKLLIHNFHGLHNTLFAPESIEIVATAIDAALVASKIEAGLVE